MTNTYNTGNSLGSTDPRDLYDNASNFDEGMNRSGPTFTDRLGNLRKTWNGMETEFDLAQAGRVAEFQAFLVASGYVSLGNYAAGLNFTAYNQYMARDGFFYRPAPSTIPFTTTGTWAGGDESLFVLMSEDAVLRQDLAEPSGAELVGFGGDTVAEALTGLQALTAGLGPTGNTAFFAGEGRAFDISKYNDAPQRLIGKALTGSQYDHFGLMDLLPSGRLCLFFRRGTTHETDRGALVFTTLQPGGTWAAPSTIASDPVYDLRDASGGVMRNGRVVVATTAHDLVTPTNFPETRFYVSDDYGVSWTLKQTFTAAPGEYRFAHGKGFPLGGKYCVPYYTNIGATRKLRLFETSDGGDTWVEGATVYSGATDYNETAYADLGGGAVLAVARIGNGSGGFLRQFLSLDGGATWADQGDVTAQNADSTDTLVSPSLSTVVSESGTVHVFLSYTNRTTLQLLYRTIPREMAIAGSAGWSDRQSLYSAPGLSGYQSHVVIGKRVLGNLFRETSPNAVAAPYQWEAFLGELPDYQSPWTAVTIATQYQFAHGLQRAPRRVDLEFAASANPTQTFKVGASYFNDGAHKGSGAQIAISGTNVTVGTGTGAVWGTSYFAGIDGSTGNRATNGFYRVRAWV